MEREVGPVGWPTDAAALRRIQQHLARLRPPSLPSPRPLRVGGCFVCFGRGGGGPGRVGDPGWAGAVVVCGHRTLASASVSGEAGAPYRPGLLAAREGPLLEQAVGGLDQAPGVLLVNATGWDHPRRAGLASQLGWRLDLPTIGVTHRPLLAQGVAPGVGVGARAPLRIGREQVGWWLRTSARANPVAVSPGWRTGLDEAVEVVAASTGDARTPEPLRRARRIARTARARASG